MSDTKDMDDRPQGEGAGRGEDPSSRPDYDPLLLPWSEEPQERRAPQADDDLWGPHVASHSARTTDGEDFFWEVPAAPATPPRYAQEVARRPRLTYEPRRYRPIYEPPMTDAQRQLHEGVITLPKPQRRWAVTVREVVETLLLALLIFLAVRASFQNFRVEGASMYPSLEDGEYLIVNKLSYAEVDLSMFDFLPLFDAGDHPVKHLWGFPSRGDVIVFRAPTSPNRDFIKRIIGTPGDTVEIGQNGEVKVNGTVLSEPYIQGTTNCNSHDCTWGIPQAGTPEAKTKCGSDSCYFVMGDNRQNSSDSRQGWLVPEENIIGKALITYWHQGGPELDLAPNHSVVAQD